MFSESRTHAYDIPLENADLVSRYRPEFLDRGGDHLVYRIPSHPRVVVKVSWRKIKDALYDCYCQGKTSDDAMREHAHLRFSDDIAQKNRDVWNLKRYFGAEHVLSERRYLLRVPVSTELLEELFRNDYQGRVLPEAAKSVKEVWTHVAVQTFCKKARDPGRLTFSYGASVEDRHPPRTLYTLITRQLLTRSAAPFDTAEFLRLQDGSVGRYLSALLERAIEDSSLADALRDFLLRAIDYANAEGRTLALGGRDNVIFFRRQGSWTYVLMDAMPVPSEPALRCYAAEVTRLARSGAEPTKGAVDNIIRVLNFVRAVNGSAHALAMETRISLPEAPEWVIEGALNERT